MVTARYSCSASMARARACGQVCGPKARVDPAASRTLASSPSAPPMADTHPRPPLAAIPQPGDMIGEGAAGEGLAALVAGDQVCALGGLEDQLGLRHLARL